MPSANDRSTGALAIVVGAVGFASVGFLALFFAVGGPFGAINDWAIGLTGVLTGLLALTIHRRGAGSSAPVRAFATGIGLAGAAIVVVGSALVISRTTGFFLAGLVESLGFALVGVWLVLVGRGLSSSMGWPRRLGQLGIVAGALMGIGVAVLPAVASGLDDLDAATGLVWLGFVGWLGIFFLYPAWAIWFGKALRK